jgi:hypothetical protein
LLVSVTLLLVVRQAITHSMSIKFEVLNTAFIKNNCTIFRSGGTMAEKGKRLLSAFPIVTEVQTKNTTRHTK